jgi:pilus assembly protein CpaB
VKQWPKNLVPEHTFQKPVDVVGRVTSSPIAKGGFISETLLAPPGTKAGLESLLKPGYRALAIKVDEVSSVGGWLQPRSKVDVNCVLRPATRNASQQSRLLLQNVEVLTVGDQIESKESGAQITRSVTLMLTPKQVNKVQLASTYGKLSLSMRNPEDESEPQDVAVDGPELFEEDKDGPGDMANAIERARRLLKMYGLDEQPAKLEPTPEDPAQTIAAAAQPKPWTVEVISNSTIQTIQFESDEPNARRLEPSDSGRRPSQVNAENDARRPGAESNPGADATNESNTPPAPQNGAPGNVTPDNGTGSNVPDFDALDNAEEAEPSFK